MKAIGFLPALVLIAAWPSLLLAEAPEIETGVNIMNGAGPLEVTWCSVPCAWDWNADGAKDLLVGQFSSGHIWLFLNQGTDLNPVFNGGTLVESNGQPITASYG